MDEEFKKVLDRLIDEVVELHYRWDMYKEVFFGGKEQTDLLNKSGSNFFYYTQHLMLDKIALMFSKLTDPNKQGKFENLSLKQVHVYASDRGELEFVAELKGKFGALIEACEKFRSLRNKRIAHGDLEHSLGIAEKPLPGISIKYVEHALQILRKYMDLVELHYSNSQTGYACIKGPYGAGGHALINALSKNA
ncbi:MAG: hypothetical protein RPS99_00180 [Gammaproteobacteria bacterium]|jgi:hypothetical protein